MTYVIEYYNQSTRRYQLLWKGHNWERAEIIFNKPYYSKMTRRLISISEQIIMKKKGHYSGN